MKAKKISIIIISSILFAGILSICLYKVITLSPNTDFSTMTNTQREEYYNAQLSFTSHETDPDALALDLLTQYFEYCKEGKVVSSFDSTSAYYDKILDYKIVSINTHGGSGCVFSAAYSIKPINSNSDSIAGNGIYDDQTGWSNDKYEFFNFEQISSTKYKFLTAGTGP